MNCYVIDQTRSVSSGYPNTEKRVQNTTRSGIDEIRGVWIADETLSRVFDRGVNQEVNFSKSMLI